MRRAPGPGTPRGMIGQLGDQLTLEVGRAASVGAASVVATATPPLAFAFFAAGACTCLTIAGLIWLAALYGWVPALAIAGGVYALVAIVIFAANGWRLSSPTVPAAAVAPIVAAAEAQGVAEGAAGVPPGAAAGLGHPGAGIEPGLGPMSKYERDLEIAMMAASAFRDASEIGRTLRGPGRGRRRRRGL
ncbi:hypothetical protein P2H44_00925 [Albimonas sp. CAU 1670]|uniref:hypothetical protein n=1 Tax=Albimonas sp. CAU 1670 TaxID=3032599 RepID=UPI0023DA7334|nr:hypothetical protein [Albimonas sp. CAU 1670]MDF2231108.1 hypothetical protein [Albimonas sp. CAU 1670]